MDILLTLFCNKKRTFTVRWGHILVDIGNMLGRLGECVILEMSVRESSRDRERGRKGERG